ncbi:MAG: fatty-acid--CoA ligase, partial [Methylocystis sp.]|nr:fatty-acid--CoA ligase [Methylocystis sp.]
RTGDLGFFHDGDCYITGRLKDLIIIAGRNFYPNDIESALEERIAGIRPGCCAAFSVTREDQESLIVVLEPDRNLTAALASNGCDELFARIRHCVVDAVDI